MEHSTKTFMSGNSVAVRLPKALGMEPNEDIEIIQDDTKALFIRRKPETRQTFANLFGSFSTEFMANRRLPSEESLRSWDAEDTNAA
ncbi:MAG: hypothetical protein WA979_11010 [Pacificimonas sp.]